MGRRWLTKAQVTAWQPDWTELDRKKVANAIEALGSDKLYTTESGEYCAALVYGHLQSYGRGLLPWEPDRIGWHRALVIYPARLEWLNGEGAAHLDRNLFTDLRETEKHSYDKEYYVIWTPLSTYGRTRSPATSKNHRASVICPRCFTELSATGECLC